MHLCDLIRLCSYIADDRHALISRCRIPAPVAHRPIMRQLRALYRPVHSIDPSTSVFDTSPKTTTFWKKTTIQFAVLINSVGGPQAL